MKPILRFEFLLSLVDNYLEQFMKISRLWMLALGAAALMAQDGDALLHERLERNPAWKRAQQTPAYDKLAPSGFVLDEAEKASQRSAGEELKSRSPPPSQKDGKNSE